MKKYLALLITVAMMLTVMVGCGDKTTGTSSTPPAASSSGSESSGIEPITLKLAHDETPESAVGQASVKFAELCKEYSDGAIEITIYDSGTLGSVDEIFESLQAGNVDFAPLSTGAISTTVPDYAVFNLSYTFQDMDQLHEMFDGDLGDLLIKQAYDNANIYIFEDTWSDGQRCYFNNKHEVNAAEDMAGLLIRVADRPTYIKPLEAMGAVPMVMSISEAYLACSQGTVDGVEMAAAPAIQNNIPDICKYMTVDGHMVTPKMFAACIAKYESLSDAQREVINKAAHETALYQRELAAEIEAAAFTQLADAGMEIKYCDNSTFKAATADAVLELAGTISDEVLVAAGIK